MPVQGTEQVQSWDSGQLRMISAGDLVAQFEEMHATVVVLGEVQKGKCALCHQPLVIASRKNLDAQEQTL